MSNAPTIANDAQLTVKELSAALGVSAHFVYQMRWNAEARGQTTTEAEARNW